MQDVDLLGAFKNTTDLDVFVNTFFSALGLVEYDERNSSNYIDERYFIGEYDNISYTISMSDEVDNEDLPFWINVSTDDVKKMNMLFDIVDNNIKTKILPAGFYIARFINFEFKDRIRIDY